MVPDSLSAEHATYVLATVRSTSYEIFYAMYSRYKIPEAHVFTPLIQEARLLDCSVDQCELSLLFGNTVF